MQIEVDDKLGHRILDAIADFESITSELRRMNRKLDRSRDREEQGAIDLAALTEKVTAGTALDESIKTLVQGIADELESHSDPAVQALATRLKAQADALSAAVVANTTS